MVVALVFIEKNLKPTILAYAEAKAKQIAVDSINDVINNKIVPDIASEELEKVHKDGNAKVTIVQPNIAKINQIQAETATEINKTLKNLSQGQFKIPLGQVMGSQLLASYGPKIKVSFVPIGTVDVKLVDKIDEAGINQTRHKMYFKVTSQVKVVIPLESSNVKVSSEVLIADNIILGEVPFTYVKIGDGNKLGLSGGINEDK